MKIYCPGCGNPLHNNEMSCSICGHQNPNFVKDIEIEKKNDVSDEQEAIRKAGVLTTISFFLICTIPIIGLIILSINMNKIKKIRSNVPGRSILYYINKICLVLGYIVIMVQAALFVNLIASFNKSSSNEPEDTITVEGHYKCIERESETEKIDYKMLLYLENDGRFAITIYDGFGFDQAFGNYVYTPINKNNESQEYKYYSIILKGDQNGYSHYEEIQDYPYMSSLEFGLRKANILENGKSYKRQEGIVTLQNGNEYYCLEDK